MNFNLLPWRHKKAEKQRLRLKIFLAAGVIAAVLTGVCIDVLIRVGITRLQEKIDRIQLLMEKQVPLSDAQKKTSVTVNDFLRFLSQLSSYGLCVTSLSENNNTLQVQGYANQADGLLTFIGMARQHNILPQTAIDEINQDSRTSLFKFTIKASY